MILAGQKDAKKRVFLFLTIYVITGFMSEFLVAIQHYEWNWYHVITAFFAVMYYGVVNIIIFNFESSFTDKRNFNTNEEVNF